MNAMVEACGTFRHKTGSYRVLVGTAEAKKRLEDLDVDGRIISKCEETE